MCCKGKKHVIYLNKEKEEEEEEWMTELPNEVWVEILKKLPIKPLNICKCVSKTWLSHVSQILSSFNKGLDLPPLGILFRQAYCVTDPISDPFNHVTDLSYLSLDGYNNFTSWSSIFHDPEPKTVIVQITQTHSRTLIHNKGHGLLSSLLIDFGSLLLDSRSSGFWTMHRGLALVTSADNLTLLIYNPATKEKFVLPTPHYSLGQTNEPVRTLTSTIINLSDCLLSTQCNFKVIRFSKRREEENGTIITRAFAEVYYSNKNQWCHSEITCPRNAILAATWVLNGAVLFCNTLLFFIHKQKRAVGVKFLLGRGEGEADQVSAFSLPLPKHNQRRRSYSNLHVSQGCLYLSLHNLCNLCIWKHDNEKSLGAKEAWIPTLIFTERSRWPHLCQPVTLSYLSGDGKFNTSTVITFLHDAPVVLVLINRFVYAFHLLNDTVEKIAELREMTYVIAVGYANMYSPCFASFQCLKRQNHQPTT